MSQNQSRVDKNESHYRKPGGRSGSFNNQRNFSGGGGGGGGKGGGGSVPPQSSTLNNSSSSLQANRSFKKSGNGQTGQSRASTGNVNTEANVSSARNSQNGVHVQPMSHGASNAPAAAKPTNPPASRSNHSVSKTPAPQTNAAVSDSIAPATPSKGETSNAFAFQFGSISPGFVNGMQIPARTSSAPPNLDEQKRDQARHGPSVVVPALPIPSAPKQQLSGNNLGKVNQPNAEKSPMPTQTKRDVQSKDPATPASSAVQKPSVYPGSGMPMSFQQLPVQFGTPNTQVQSQGITGTSMPMPMPMPLPIGNSNMPQQVFVPGHQTHPLQPPQVMMHGHSLGFPPQIGHQLAPQIGSLPMGMASPFRQQAGNYGSARKAMVKITHPDTHEELKLDNKTDLHMDAGSSTTMLNATMTPQSLPAPSFTPAQNINYYSPVPSSTYNPNGFFQSQTTLPTTTTQITVGSPPQRYNYSVSQGPPTVSLMNPSARGPKLGSPSVTISSPLVNKGESPDTLRPPKEAGKCYPQKDNVIASESSVQPSKSVVEQESAPVLTKEEGTRRENISMPNSITDPQKKLAEKDLENAQLHRQEFSSVGSAKPFPSLVSSEVAKHAENVLDPAEEVESSTGNNGVRIGKLSTSKPSNNCSFELERNASVKHEDHTLQEVELKQEIPLPVEEEQDKSSELLIGSGNTFPCEGNGKNAELNVEEAGAGSEAGKVESKQAMASSSQVDRTIDNAADSDTVALESSGKSSESSISDLPSTSVSSSKDKPELTKTKSTTSKLKKKRKDILKAADAAGSTADLYMAYKGPEEKHEISISSQSVGSSNDDGLKHPPADNAEKDVNEKDSQNKGEPDDWEDVADISTPKLKMSDGGKLHNDRNGSGNTSRMYTRDFLLTFSEHCTDLPDNFVIGPDIADALMSIKIAISHLDRESYPNSGRNLDRSSSVGPRHDRRGSGTYEDNKWSKSPGPFAGRDPRMEIGHGGGAVVGLRPGQGGNHGVLRNPRGHPSGQFVGGILSGPMQSIGPQGGMQRNNSDADRWQRATGIQRGLIPSPQTPLQIMHKAERKYEVGKVSDKEQAKQRQLKSILNKLTPQNFEKLFEQVKEVNIDNTVTLTGVISQIFDKALMEPTFCEMYANFCFHLSSELPDFTEDNEKITFKRLLLNKCQEEFERGEREQAEADRVEEEGEIKRSEEEREEKRIRARRQMLGNIRLIGELYKKKMLTERIMHECITKLLGEYQNPDEENLEALCKLMSTIGEMIDHAKAKDYIDAYFDWMFKLSNNMKLSSRVRFMLKDAIDLRKNNWRQRRKVEGPKKIEDVHRDAAQERQAQTSRLARGPSFGSSTRRGQALDFGARGSSMLSSPSSQMSGLQRFPSQVRGYGGQDARLEERHHYESRSFAVPLSERSNTNDSITLGPQGGLARGMSRGPPLISNPPLTDMSVNAGDSRRTAGGPNGYSSMSDRTPHEPREELATRSISGKFTGASAYEQSNSHEPPTFFRNRDSRIVDRAPDRSSVPQMREQGSSTGAPTVASQKVWSEERMHAESISTIREFYSAKDEGEVALRVKEMNAPGFCSSMISIWIIDSFERKDMERDLLAKLLISLFKSHNRLLTEEQFLKGFESVFSTLEDAVNDAPKAGEFLGRVLAKLIAEKIISLRETGRLIKEGGEEPWCLVQTGLAAEVLGTVLETIKTEKGESVLNEIRRASNLQLEQFRGPANKSKKLETFI